MDIQYFPGHMTKAKRNIEADLKLIDLCIELRDARAPEATSNPMLDKLIKGKERLILLNKSDLADKNITENWIKKLSDDNTTVVSLDSRNTGGISSVKSKIADIARVKQEIDRQRGINGKRPVKAMICGIPNVGKSTFINSMLGKSSVKTGNKPGVTRGNQWVNVNDTLLLLDTPGVLWPKFEDKLVAEHLAMIGAINDQVINREEISVKLLSFLYKNYQDLLYSRYDIIEEALQSEMDNVSDLIPGLDRKALALLNIISVKRGCIKKKAEPDYDKSSRLILDDFRSGRIGRITLER